MTRNKYHASKTELDGIRFDSRKEAARYSELKLLERAGAIRDLQLQVPLQKVRHHNAQTGNFSQSLRMDIYYAGQYGAWPAYCLDRARTDQLCDERGGV